MNCLITSDFFGQFHHRLRCTPISNLICTFTLANSAGTSRFVHKATARRQKPDWCIARTILVTLHSLLETGPDNRQSQCNRRISQKHFLSKYSQKPSWYARTFPPLEHATRKTTECTSPHNSDIGVVRFGLGIEPDLWSNCRSQNAGTYFIREPASKPEIEILQTIWSTLRDASTFLLAKVQTVSLTRWTLKIKNIPMAFSFL